MTETDTVPETEQKEVTEGDEVTPVIETDVTDEEPSVKNDAENVPEVADTEATEKTPEETPEDDEIQSADINAVTPSDTVISEEFVNDPTTDTTANTATIVYLNGCVDSAMKLAKNKPLKFRVELSAGRKLAASDPVVVTIGEGDTAKTEKPTTDANGIYTVAADKFVNGTENLPAKITVKTAAIGGYKVKFAKDTATGALEPTTWEIYKITTTGEGEDAKDLLGTALDAGAETAVDFKKSQRFAIVVPNDANKFVKLTLDGQEITTKAAEYKKEASDSENTKVLEFTVDPSDAKYPILSQATADNTPATVSVLVLAKATLTITTEADTAAEIGAPAAAGETTDIKYVAGDTNAFSGAPTMESDEALATKSLLFKASVKAANANTHKIESVTVTALDENNNSVATLTATKVGDTDDYRISLAPLKDFAVDTTLKISVKTALDTDKADKVRTVNFKNKDGEAPAHVKIEYKEGSGDAKPLDLTKGTSLTTKEDTVTVILKLDTGYEIEKGIVTEDADNEDATEKTFITIKGTKVYPANPDANPALEKVEKTFEDKIEVVQAGNALKLVDLDADYAADASDARAYYISALDVIINTVVTKNSTAKSVKIVNNDDLEYEITNPNTEVFEDTDAGNTGDVFYWVNETTQTIKLAAKAEKEPGVTCTGYTDAIKAATAAEGTYTFEIPVAAIANEDDESYALITITEGADVPADSATVTAVVDADDVEIYDVEDEDTDLLDSAVEDEGAYTIDSTLSVGDSVNYIFRAKEGASITKVSYTMENGEEAAKTGEAVKNNRTGDYTLSLTLTGALAITVESKSDVRVVLYDMDQPEDSDKLTLVDDTWKVEYKKAKNIGVRLVKAETNQNISFYDIVVKDGSATALTEAEVQAGNQSAKIAAVHKDEYGKPLTIEVYQKGVKEPYKTTLLTTKGSEAVSVTYVNGRNKTVDASKEPANLQVDSEMTFKVKAENGANLSDLGVEVLADSDTRDTTADAAAAAKVEAVSIAKVNDTEGTIKVTAKPAKAANGTIRVRIYNTEAKGEDGTTPDRTTLEAKGGLFKINLTDPVIKTTEIKSLKAVAGSPTNREVRINLGLELDKNVKKNGFTKPKTNKLYYMIEPVKPTQTAKDVTLYETAEMLDYIEADEFGTPKNNLPYTINLVKSNSADVKSGDVITEYANIYATFETKVKVTLIQMVDGTTPVKGTALAEDKYVAHSSTAELSLSTKEPVYETKLTVKAVNGAKVFTGQSTVVATPNFTGDTTKDVLTVQFVNTEKGKNTLIGSASTAYGEAGAAKDSASNYKAWVDPVNNSIHVKISSSVKATWAASKNLGLKVTAEEPGSSHAASAIIKLKVQQGIYSIGIDESKAATPETLWKDKKKASFKLTALLNGGSNKPAKAKVKWEIAKADVNDSDYAESALAGSKPLVKIDQKGTVTVDAKYQVKGSSNDNMYTVTISPDDFEGNTAAPKTMTFEITDRKDAIGSLVLVRSDDSVVNTSTLGAEDFEAGDIYVAAVRSGAEPVNDKYSSADYVPATFTSGSKAAMTIGSRSGNKALLELVKPGATNIKITAKAVDGSKATKTLTFKVANYQEIALKIVDPDGIENILKNGEGLEYSGGSNEKFALYPYYKDENGDYQECKLKNFTVKVTNGKFVSNPNYKKYTDKLIGWAVVVASDSKDTAEITLTDTSNKVKTANNTKCTIKNNGWSKVKAPGIKLYQTVAYSLNGNIIGNKVTRDTDEITWQVNEKNKELKNYAGYYVNLEVDHTVPNNNGASSLLGGDKQVLKIDENGRFTLYNPYYSSVYKSYKLVATIGTFENGNFTAKAKSVKISLSVPTVKAKKDTLSMGTKYKLDADTTARVPLSVKSEIGYTVTAENVILKSADQKSTKTHKNDFTTYFDVQPSGTYDKNDVQIYTIGLRSDLTKAQIDTISDGSAASNANCQGYITVDNGVYRKDFLVKVTVTKKKGSFKLSGDTLLLNAANKTVNANVSLLSGKNTVKAVAVKVVDGAGFVTNTTTGATALADGSIQLTGAAASAGIYNVKLRVLPETSGYIKKNDAGAWIPVTAAAGGTTYADLAAVCDDCGVELTAKIVLKALDTKKLTKVKTTKITVTPNDYERGAVGSKGNYVVYVPYDITVKGTTIAANDADATKTGVRLDFGDNNAKNKVVKTAAVGEGQPGTVDLVTGVETVTDDGTDYIKISVSKEALLLLGNSELNPRPVTGYNKKLKVPVKIRYSADTGVTTEDSLTFELKFPKDAPTDLAGVKALLEDEKSGLADVKTKNLFTAKSILETLLGDVQNKAEKLISKDTDVHIDGVEISPVYAANETPDDFTSDTDNSQRYAKIMEKGQAKIVLNLVDGSLAATDPKHADKVEKTYDIDVKSSNSAADDDSIDWDELDTDEASVIANAIRSKSFTVDNNTEKDDLVKQAKEIETVKDILGDGKGKQNISLRIVFFYKEKATERKDGRIDAVFMVKNLASGVTECASFTEDESNSISIGKQDNMSTAVTAVNNAFTNTLIERIINDSSAQPNVMKEYILSEAEKKINNSDITVEFVQQDVQEGGSTVKKDIAITMPTDSAAGTVKFQLVLKNSRGKAIKTSVFTDNTTLVANTAEKYETLANVKTKVNTDLFDSAEDYTKLKTAIGSSVGNTETAVKTAIKRAVETVLANYKGYEAAWAKKAGTDDDDFTYDEATQNKMGGVTFTIEIINKGAKAAGMTSGVSETITVNIAGTETTGLIAKDATNQTMDELEKAIKEIGKDATDNALTVTDLPADAADAKTNTVLTGALSNAKKNTNLTVELADNGTYTKTDDSATYTVNITIKKSDTEKKEFSHTFNFKKSS